MHCGEVCVFHVVYSMLIILEHFKVEIVQKHQRCWQSVDFMLSILGRAHWGALRCTRVRGALGRTLVYLGTLWYTRLHGTLQYI